MKLHRSWASVMALLAAAWLTGAGPMPALASGPASAPAGGTGATSLAQIEQMIGQAPCTSDSQCRVAGIGSRACGGPESYLAWSIHGTEKQALEKLLQAHASQRELWHQKMGLMSTCEFRAAPGVRCERAGGQAGRCVLTPAQANVR